MTSILIYDNLKHLLILTLLLSIYVGQSISSWTLLPQKEAEKTVPKIIIQTTHLEVPRKVTNQFDKYAKGYKRIVYNEHQARQFLRFDYINYVYRREYVEINFYPNITILGTIIILVFSRNMIHSLTELIRQIFLGSINLSI
jgi:uncharacterized protein YxeA